MQAMYMYYVIHVQYITKSPLSVHLDISMIECTVTLKSGVHDFLPTSLSGSILQGPPLAQTGCFVHSLEINQLGL